MTCLGNSSAWSSMCAELHVEPESALATTVYAAFMHPDEPAALRAVVRAGAQDAVLAADALGGVRAVVAFVSTLPGAPRGR